MAEGDTLISVDYEIFGKVQGVFFRKYTQVRGLRAFGACGGCARGNEGSVSTRCRRRSWLLSSCMPKVVCRAVG